MTNLPQLPSEVWAHIAWFACTDGGKTDAALLCVSRLVASGAAAHAFSIVVIAGSKHATQFILCFRHVPVERRRVRSLLIGDGGGPYDRFLTKSTLHNSLPELLDLVSPSLEYLTLIPNKALTWTLGGICFPALRSLTVHPLHDDDGRRTYNLRMPKITHLHVTMMSYGYAAYMQFIIEAVSQSQCLSHVTLARYQRTPEALQTLQRFVSHEEDDLAELELDGILICLIRLSQSQLIPVV
jgi:hypothetical protein